MKTLWMCDRPSVADVTGLFEFGAIRGAGFINVSNLPTLSHLMLLRLGRCLTHVLVK